MKEIVKKKTQYAGHLREDRAQNKRQMSWKGNTTENEQKDNSEEHGWA